MTKLKKKVVVIGAGHNALTCASYLAKSGFEVEVHESRSEVGGMACTREFTEGYKVPGVAHLLHMLNPGIQKWLGLNKNGLEFAASRLKTISLNPNGNALVIDGDHLEGDGITDQHRAEFKSFKKKTNSLAQFFRSAYQISPPRIRTDNKKDLLGLMQTGWNLRTMGNEGMTDMLRFIAINVFDLFDEYFDNDFIKGSLAIDAVLGNHLGPRTNNSVITYLHTLTG